MKCKQTIISKFFILGMVGVTFLNPVQAHAETIEINKVSGVPIYEEILPASPLHRPKKAMTPEYITIHNTANNVSGADADMHSLYLHNNTETYVSWHFTVDNHKIIEHLPIDEVGYHAGDSAGKGNRSSIGIEICENADGNYSQAEKNAAHLVAQLLYECNLTIDRVVPHQHWTGKNCPQNMLEKTDGSMGWDAFIKLVDKEHKAILKKNNEAKLKKDIASATPALEIKMDTTSKIGLYATEENKSRSLTEKDGLISFERKTTTPTILDTTDMKYNITTVGMNKESQEQDFFKLWNNDKVKHSETKLINKKGEIQKEGLDEITFTQGDKKYTFMVHTYLNNNPTLMTNMQVFMDTGNPTTLFTSNTLIADWRIANPEIATIRQGEITGLKPGKTKIQTTINGVVFSQDLVVSE